MTTKYNDVPHPFHIPVSFSFPDPSTSFHFTTNIEICFIIVDCQRTGVATRVDYYLKSWYEYRINRNVIFKICIFNPYYPNLQQLNKKTNLMKQLY